MNGIDRHFSIIRKEPWSELYKFEELKNTKVMIEGYWRNRHFVIGKNHWCCPVIYVQILPEDDYEYGDQNLPDGYIGRAYWLPEDKRDDKRYFGIGHDFGDDYNPYDEHRGWDQTEKHKYSYAELLMEVVEIASQIETDHLYKLNSKLYQIKEILNGSD